VFPEQTGELLVALAVGKLFTVTVVDEVAVQPEEVTVTVYDPPIAAVTLGRVGFCAVEVYPPGPVHA
jgi:hypothetical protein